MLTTPPLEKNPAGPHGQ